MSKNRVRTLPDPLPHLSLFQHLMELKEWKKNESENYNENSVTGLEVIIDGEIEVVTNQLKGKREAYFEQLCKSMEKNSLAKLYADPRFTNADHNTTALNILYRKIENEFALTVDGCTLAKNGHLSMIVPRPVIMSKESIRDISAFAEMLSDAYYAGRKHYVVPEVEYDDEFVMEVFYLCDSALQVAKLRHSYDRDDLFGTWILFDGNDLPIAEFEDVESCLLFPLEEWESMLGDEGIAGL